MNTLSFLVVLLLRSGAPFLDTTIPYPDPGTLVEGRANCTLSFERHLMTSGASGGGPDWLDMVTTKTRLVQC